MVVSVIVLFIRPRSRWALVVAVYVKGKVFPFTVNLVGTGEVTEPGEIVSQ
jgi:hypothetical protein